MAEKQEVKYPVTMDLKVIMISEPGESRNESELDKILKDLDIPLNSSWKTEKSSGGKYTAYTGTVFILSHEKMVDLFALLKAHPRVKFAL